MARVFDGAEWITVDMPEQDRPPLPRPSTAMNTPTGQARDYVAREAGYTYDAARELNQVPVQANYTSQQWRYPGPGYGEDEVQPYGWYQGKYQGESPAITLNQPPRETAPGEDEWWPRGNVLAHEFGHHWHDYRLPDEDQWNWREEYPDVTFGPETAEKVRESWAGQSPAEIAYDANEWYAINAATPTRMREDSREISPLYGDESLRERWYPGLWR